MRSAALLLAFIFAAAPGTAAVAQPPAAGQPAVDPGLESELAAVDTKAASVKDLSSTFEQTKKTALLRKPLVSNGKVRVRGSQVRWDTEKPHATSMLIDGSQIRMYYPEQETLEVFDVDESMKRITASPLPRLEAIRQQFSIARADPKDLGVTEGADRYICILLRPRDEATRRYVEQVRVLIERASACASTVEITDADGDTTTIVFREIRTNTGLTEADLLLNVPAGTNVVKPLQGLKGGAPDQPAKTGGKP